MFGYVTFNMKYYNLGQIFYKTKSADWSLVTQPMLQTTPNQTELTLMVSKSVFNVDSKNVSEKFLQRHSWKMYFKGKNLKKMIFSGVTVEELFTYIFEIYIKNGFRNHQS